MPKLERRGGQEEHPVEDAAKRTLHKLTFLTGSLVGEEAGQASPRVLEVMGFVEDQQRKLDIKFAEALRPRTP